MSTFLKPTVNDFILLFGNTESLELSNLENPSELQIDEERIQNAINLSYEFVMSHDSLCFFPGKVALRRAIRRLTLDIARYFLDSLQRREDVTTNYENCIDFLKMCVDTKDGVIALSPEEEIELGLDGINQHPKIYFKTGRRAFTDKSLAPYRNRQLYRY